MSDMTILTPEQRDAESAREDRGKCVNCDSYGPIFVLPTGHRFCTECTGAYVSWELDGGRAEEPDMFSWLWWEKEEDFINGLLVLLGGQP